ncbi:MAG: hypothetical protein JNL98_26980 [Bryobacterales bacterium]|nr:hypothetical protein [Bryobacterales bacterium]
MTLLAALLAIASLAFAAYSSRGGGKPLVLALTLLCFGVAGINPLVEAVVFEVMPIHDVPLALLRHLILSCAASLAIVAALRKWVPGERVQLQWTALRVTGAVISYVILYVVAGAFVYPFVKEFYATRTLPPLSSLIALQVIRGLLYALYARPYLQLAPRHPALVLASVYSVIGGVALLLASDNPYMPREVRMPHLVEVGVSNFLFGLITGKLLALRNPAPAR